MTGQPFSPRYFQQILGGNNVRFDSMVMSMALTAVREIDGALEPVLFHRLQSERYVAGQDTSSPEIVARIAVELLNGEGHDISESEFSALLTHGKQLAKQTRQRMENAQALMSRVKASGVPLLLVQVGETLHPLNGMDLYADPAYLIEKIKHIVSTAA
jgi:putative protein-disulfide isomerase